MKQKQTEDLCVTTSGLSLLNVYSDLSKIIDLPDQTEEIQSLNKFSRNE